MMQMKSCQNNSIFTLDLLDLSTTMNDSSSHSHTCTKSDGRKGSDRLERSSNRQMTKPGADVMSKF